MTVYPAGSFDQPDQFGQLLSEYWTRWYGGSGSARKFCEALARLWKNPADLFQAALDRTAWETLPLFEEAECLPIVLRESLINTQPAALEAWDQTSRVFDDGLLFDVPAAISPQFYHPVPTDLVHCVLLTDTITQPEISWSAGLDYGLSLQRRSWVFQQNPFEVFTPEDVYDNQGNRIDRQVTLWGWSVQRDRRWLQLLLGTVIGVDAPSSEAYRQLLLAAMRSTTCGVSAADVRKILTAATGIPLAESQETVERVGSDYRGRYVVTNRRVYRLPTTATAAVSAGQTLEPGDPISPALRLDTLHRGALPPGLASLTVGEGMLPWKTGGPLSFDNQLVAVTTLPTENGPRVSFPLGGAPETVDRFWEEVHARGVSQGRLLSSYLDPLRRQPAPAEALPTQINPLLFLAENVFRGPVSVCQIQLDQIPSEDANGRLAWLAALSEVLPPWGKLFLVLVVTLERERIDPANSDPDQGPRIREEPSLWDDFPSSGEQVNPASLVRDGFQFVMTEQGCET